MKHDLVKILCCPVDKGNLALDVDREEAGDVLAGRLTCETCGHAYPIEDGIPNLLPPDLVADDA